MRLVGQAHHHTPEGIHNYLLELREIRKGAALTDEEYAVLGPAILNLLASKQMAFGQAAPGSVLLDGLRGPGH